MLTSADGLLKRADVGSGRLERDDGPHPGWDQDDVDGVAEGGGDGALAVQVPPGDLAGTEGGPNFGARRPNGVVGDGRRAFLDAGDGLGGCGFQGGEKLSGDPGPGDVGGLAPGGGIVR